jgi:hypothetical protein
MGSWFKTSQTPTRVIRSAVKRPGRIVEKASASLKPKRSGVPVGLIVGPALGAVAVLAAVWFLPELVRYVKIEMM